MSKKLRIGIALAAINTFDVNQKGNVWGDELIARSWHKYLSLRDEVETVYLTNSAGVLNLLDCNLDVLIHFHPNLTLHPQAKNIYYLQNAFPKEDYIGGTVGVFQAVKDNYDGFIFTSEKLMKACTPGGVVPFATDPEFFTPQFSEDYTHPVSFVGNSIRSAVVNQRYFVPALPFGLVIYGLKAWQHPLSKASRGKLSMPDLPKVYTSSLVNLNAHIVEHAEWGTINLRIYDILACGGFIISDRMDALEETFGEVVVCSDGYEDTWVKLVHYLSDSQERNRRRQEGRNMILSNHSYAHRMETVVQYLQEIV